MTPDQIRTIVTLAGFEPTDAELERVAPLIDQGWTFAAQLRTPELDSVVPWTPPS